METRIVLRVGNKERVVTAEQATEILAIFQQGEAWESHYNSAKDGKPAYYAYKVLDEPLGIVSMEVLPPGMYEIAKLAGGK